MLPRLKRAHYCCFRPRCARADAARIADGRYCFASGRLISKRRPMAAKSSMAGFSIARAMPRKVICLMPAAAPQAQSKYRLSTMRRRRGFPILPSHYFYLFAFYLLRHMSFMRFARRQSGALLDFNDAGRHKKPASTAAFFESADDNQR